MNEFANVQPALLATSLGGAMLVAAVALAPVLAAYWLLSRAARSRSVAAAASGASAAVTESTSVAALRHEMLANYERLRRAGEAVPLATEVWSRLRSRSDVLPAAVARQVARAYQAVEVGHRLLAAGAAYDSRGHLSIRRRRLALWPTLEAALRSALAAIGTEVTPARPLVEEARRESRCNRDQEAAPALAASSSAAKAFSLSAAPRLALFYDSDGAAAGRPFAAEKAPARPRAAKRKRLAAHVSTRPDADDRQLVLWESVA